MKFERINEDTRKSIASDATKAHQFHDERTRRETTPASKTAKAPVEPKTTTPGQKTFIAPRDVKITQPEKVKVSPSPIPHERIGAGTPDKDTPGHPEDETKHRNTPR